MSTVDKSTVYFSTSPSFISFSSTPEFQTQAGKYPWIMAINFGSTSGSNPGGCAATLVSSNWAITAAHCITDTGSDTKDKLSLVLGEFDLSSSSDSNDGKR